VVQLLLTQFNGRLDLNLVDEDGNTALHYAIICENFGIARLLINSGSRTDIVDVDGETALSLAVGTELADLFTV
jgi:ankyrin repeat protein